MLNIKISLKVVLFALTGFSLQASAPALAHAADASAGDSFIQTLGTSYFVYSGRPALTRIKDLPNLTKEADPEEGARCQAFYEPLLRKQKLRIQVSFGYFDNSTGSDFHYGIEDFGMNSSQDRAFYDMFIRTLTASCRGSLKLCDFDEQHPGQFVRTITAPYDRQLEVEIDTNSASLTPFYKLNTGELAAEQNARSEASRQAYLDALGTDDVVFYIGHSRNGGGPDFFPPHLLSNLKVNYRGYYEKVRPGYHDLMDALTSSSPKPALIGMFSCLSEAWFGRGLMEASPETGYILTPSDIFAPMTEVYNAAAASLDSLLRFQCYDGISSEIQEARSMPNYNVHVRNFLSGKHPVDTHAVITAPPID